MPVQLVVISTACSHRYSSFPLEVSHRHAVYIWIWYSAPRSVFTLEVRSCYVIMTQIWYNYVIIIITIIIISCPWQCAFHVLTGCQRLQHSARIQASHEFVRETQFSKSGMLVFAELFSSLFLEGNRTKKWILDDKERVKWTDSS